MTRGNIDDFLSGLFHQVKRALSLLIRFHALIEHDVEASPVRADFGGDADRKSPLGHIADNDRIGADSGVLADVDGSGNFGPRAHPNSVSDGWEAGVATSNSPPDGDAMANGDIVSQLHRPDDHATEMTDVEASTDLSLGADAYAGCDFNEALREEIWGEQQASNYTRGALVVETLTEAINDRRLKTLTKN